LPDGTRQPVILLYEKILLIASFISKVLFILKRTKVVKALF